MLCLSVHLRLESDLGTPLNGDTLFGHVCWQVRLRHGEDRLKRVLSGYAEGRPFLVVSDGLPRGFRPKPTLPPPPLSVGVTDEAWRVRKAWTKRRWLPTASFQRPLIESLDDLTLAEPTPTETILQYHNTVNRLTGTTGEGAFAPFLTHKMTAPKAYELTVICVSDPERFSKDDLHQSFADVGASGYGRDASTGLGRFTVTGIAECPAPEPASTVVTLAAAALDPVQVHAERCYWKPVVRFGRHGGPAAGGQVFKQPVLMASAGAMLTLSDPTTAVAGYVGRGLGGGGRLSKRIPETVHQGYAPIAAIDLRGWDG